jgi:hypothetical protein
MKSTCFKEGHSNLRCIFPSSNHILAHYAPGLISSPLVGHILELYSRGMLHGR